MIHLTVQQLSASLDGALTGPSLELVVRHLAACHDCRDRQARLAKHDDALRRLLAQDPSDMFLDDLTRRAEALATAIARGIPAPIMVTSVPLLHEEDPFAPVEPPPLPPRPELGKSGQIAKEAGWGRIGVKPTASSSAPQSDPEEAKRMLEALASGNTDDFTELTAQGLQEHTHIDGPVFDLPAWIKDQGAREAPRVEGPREVPRVKLFFEDLDEQATGMTREAVNEVFRRDSEPERPGLEQGPPPPDWDADEARAFESPPRDHAAYAPPGWNADSETRDSAAHDTQDWDAPPAHPESGAYAQPGREAGYAAPGSAEYAPAGWHYEPGPPAEGNDPAWGAGEIDPASLESGAYPRPLVGDFGGYHPEGEPARPQGAGRSPGMDRVAVLALATVGALLLILLALQLVPAGPRRASHAGSHGLTGGGLPRVQILRHDEPSAAPVAPQPNVRTAETPAPVEELVPRRAIPVPAEETEHVTPVPAADAAGATADDATSTPAASGEDAKRSLLCGQVVNEAGAPVANALVSMAEISFATRTDERGHFCVSAPGGPHTLFVQGSGFTPQRVPVTISSASMDVRIRLQPAR